MLTCYISLTLIYLLRWDHHSAACNVATLSSSSYSDIDPYNDFYIDDSECSSYDSCCDCWSWRYRWSLRILRLRNRWRMRLIVLYNKLGKFDSFTMKWSPFLNYSTLLRLLLTLIINLMQQQHQRLADTRPLNADRTCAWYFWVVAWVVRESRIDAERVSGRAALVLNE